MFENKNYHYGYMTERHFYTGSSNLVGLTKKDILNITNIDDLEDLGPSYESICNMAERAADCKGGYAVYVYDENAVRVNIVDRTVFDDEMDFLTWTVDRKPYNMYGWLYNTDKRAYFEALKEASVIKTDLKYEDVVEDDTLDEILGDIIGEFLDENGPLNDVLTEEMCLHCLEKYGYWDDPDFDWDWVYNNNTFYDDEYAHEAFIKALKELGGIRDGLDRLFQERLDAAAADK